MSTIGEEPYEFSDSVAEAELLLAYAAERGIPIPPGDIDAILTIVRLPTGQAAAKGDEAAFWAAFSRLAKSVNPATVQSLKATNQNVGVRTLIVGPMRSLTLPQEAVRRYRLWALAAVAALLFMQTYAFVGTTVLASVPALRQRRADLNAEKARVQHDLAVRNGIAAEDPDFLRIDAQVTTADEELKATLAIIDDWNGVWRRLFSLIGAPRRGLQRLSRLFRSEPSNDVSGPSDSTPDKPHVDLGTGQLAEVAADVALRAVHGFFLPLLFGWVGACAFILRRLSAEISNVTYSAVSESSYRLRMPLGALAGMAIAWFVALPSNATTDVTPGVFAVSATPAPTAGSAAHGNAKPATKTTDNHAVAEAQPGIPPLRTLSAAALAFLAGYSVELLFAMMDAIIGAFSNTSARS